MSSTLTFAQLADLALGMSFINFLFVLLITDGFLTFTIVNFDNILYYRYLKFF